MTLLFMYVYSYHGVNTIRRLLSESNYIVIFGVDFIAIFVFFRFIQYGFIYVLLLLFKVNISCRSYVDFFSIIFMVTQIVQQK